MIVYIDGAHKVLSDGTLMTYSKKELIRYIRMLENNYQNEVERRNNQNKHLDELRTRIHIEAPSAYEIIAKIENNTNWEHLFKHD